MFLKLDAQRASISLFYLMLLSEPDFENQKIYILKTHG
jgi:hypothetical protein